MNADEYLCYTNKQNNLYLNQVEKSCIQKLVNK